MMKRGIYIVFLLILLGSLVVSCQPKTGVETEPPPSTKEEVVPPAPGEVVPPSPEGPAPTTVLNLYDSDDPSTLDPAVAGEARSHGYIVQIFSGLVRLDDNLEPTPDIARRWEVSKDGRTYTFDLRNDVKFQDGRQVKAEDFKYSLERACWPETGSLTAGTYLGDIVGVQEVLDGKSREISGVKVLDDYTLEVTIDAPKSYFISKLTYSTAFVVDRKNVASGSQWWRRPNGTGPFKLKEWDVNTQLVLERNALYYGEKAKIGSVVYKILSGVPINMYEQGEIDIAGVSRAYIDKVTDPSGPFYQDLVVVPQLSFYYIGFNTAKPPFDDVNVRRAFSMAIDKEKLASLVFRGMVTPAHGILPPGLPGFNEGLPGLQFDVQRAKQLIKESKYGDVSQLPPITITTSGWGGLASGYLEAIVHEWQQNLGVEIKVRQLEPQRYFYYLMQEKDEMFDLGWVADYPHPQNFLDILFHTGSQNNYGEYSHPGVDSLLEKAGVAQDETTSMALYRQAEQKLVEDAACLPLWFDKQYLLVRPYVKGYRLSPQGLALLKAVSIE